MRSRSRNVIREKLFRKCRVENELFTRGERYLNGQMGESCMFLRLQDSAGLAQKVDYSFDGIVFPCELSTIAGISPPRSCTSFWNSSELYRIRPAASMSRSTVSSGKLKDVEMLEK